MSTGGISRGRRPPAAPANPKSPSVEGVALGSIRKGFSSGHAYHSRKLITPRPCVSYHCSRDAWPPSRMVVFKLPTSPIPPFPTSPFVPAGHSRYYEPVNLPWRGMAGVTLPVSRPIGRALVVGSAPCRSAPVLTLQQLGYQCAEAEDPYAAMSELCRRPLVYRAIILALGSLYREELQIVLAVKQRFPHVEVWLAQTDGRAAALAESSRLGADGLISDEGLHRLCADRYSRADLMIRF